MVAAAVYFMVMFICLGLVLVIALIRGLPVGRHITIVMSLALVAAQNLVFPGRVGDVVAVAFAAYGIWVVLYRFPPRSTSP